MSNSTYNILNRGNYLLDQNMVLNRITEYDISKANINLLKVAGKIDDKLYNELYQSDRLKRQIQIGLIMKSDPSIYKVLSSSLAAYRLRFYEENNILDEDILAIKNDAIFVINKEATITTFDKYINFVKKNQYTSYFLISRKEFYYDVATDTLDVKGISNDKLTLHDGGMNELFKTVFSLIEMGRYEDALEAVSVVYNDFMDCEIGNTKMYREFTAGSRYKIKNIGTTLDIDVVPRDMYNIVENVKILMELQKLIVSLLV